MDESPKFLCSIGQDHKAVEVIHHMAKRNGVASTLKVEDLRKAALPHIHAGERTNAITSDGNEALTAFSTWQLVKNSFSEVNGEHTKGLFATRRLAYSTSLIIFIYGALGLAYPLFKYVYQKRKYFGKSILIPVCS